jgi:hypothetical protein
VRLDTFTRVKKAIDDLAVQLSKEKGDEIKHTDFCVKEFNTNQLQTKKKAHEKEDLLAFIGLPMTQAQGFLRRGLQNELLALIEDLQPQIKTLTSEIAVTTG